MSTYHGGSRRQLTEVYACRGGGGVREMDVGGVRERERLLTICKHFHLKLKLTL